MTEKSDKKSDGSVCGCGGESCCRGQSKWVWIVLALAVAGVLIAKKAGNRPALSASVAPVVNSSRAVEPGGSTAKPLPFAPLSKALPRLVDLGAGKCLPCKMMTPVLEDLKASYSGTMDVQFIDVWENPEVGKKYEIFMIPTQIFFDAAGNELFRHEGFITKDDILAKWKDLGVELASQPQSSVAGKKE